METSHEAGDLIAKGERLIGVRNSRHSTRLWGLNGKRDHLRRSVRERPASFGCAETQSAIVANSDAESATLLDTKHCTVFR